MIYRGPETVTDEITRVLMREGVPPGSASAAAKALSRLVGGQRATRGKVAALIAIMQAQHGNWCALELEQFAQLHQRMDADSSAERLALRELKTYSRSLLIVAVTSLALLAVTVATLAIVLGARG